MHVVIIVVLVGVVASLGHALMSMSSGSAGAVGAERSLRMVKALTVRIALSVALFVCLLAGHYMGWIQPRVH